MTELTILSAMLIGISGSIHCVGMCGGIVTALSFAIPVNSPRNVYIACYQVGRILSYCCAGALAGFFGQAISTRIPAGAQTLQIVSGLFLILLGLYLSNWWKFLSKLEALGGHLWRFLAPLSKKLLPLNSAFQALLYGLIWGWLPCGLVYSTLAWSFSSGSALNGGITMLFFGIGTLPALISLSIFSTELRQLVKKKTVRISISILMLLLGLYSILSVLVSLYSSA